MDRRELLDRAARDEDERLLLGRVWDKWEQCRQRNIPTATDFLSPQEQAAAQRLLHTLGVQDGYVFFGGYDGAERQRLFFLPDWAETPDADAVAAVAATWYGGEHLTHRDFLGSLMGLGLTRGTIGDILVTEDRCQVLTLPKTAEFLLSAWESAGRVRLKTAPLPLEELEIPAQACRGAPGYRVLPAAGQRAGGGVFPQPWACGGGRGKGRGAGKLDGVPEAG